MVELLFVESQLPARIYFGAKLFRCISYGPLGFGASAAAGGPTSRLLGLSDTGTHQLPIARACREV